MKTKLVSDLNDVHLWNVKNQAYGVMGAKQKKRIKQLGFRAWLGTLPRSQLELIHARVFEYKR